MQQQTRQKKKEWEWKRERKMDDKLKLKRMLKKELNNYKEYIKGYSCSSFFFLVYEKKTI